MRKKLVVIFKDPQPKTAEVKHLGAALNFDYEADKAELVVLRQIPTDCSCVQK